jgi:peroxiredoxin
MKRYLILCLVCLLHITVLAQKQLPAVQVETLKGKKINTSSLLNDSVPVVVAFWATFCEPCFKELDAFVEHIEDWQKEVKFKIAAVSIDDARFSAKVRSLVASHEWTAFTILLDKNQNFKRAMNVSAVPHLYIVDTQGNIVYSQIGYMPGNETKVLKILKGLK